MAPCAHSILLATLLSDAVHLAAVPRRSARRSTLICVAFRIVRAMRVKLFGLRVGNGNIEAVKRHRNKAVEADEIN
jgi:hypothetical protein